MIELDTLACHDGPDLAWKPKTLGATRHLVRSITVEVSAPRLLPSPGCTFPSCPTTSRPGAAQRQTGLGHYASQLQTGPARHPHHLALFSWVFCKGQILEWEASRHNPKSIKGRRRTGFEVIPHSYQLNLTQVILLPVLDVMLFFQKYSCL